jgi:hypothetical protein
MPNTVSKAVVNVDLAYWKDLAFYVPKIGDFIVWHGWFSRWYGIVGEIDKDTLTVIKDNLPKLLFTMPQFDYKKNSIKLSISKIRSSRGGEYSVLQERTWLIDT